MAIPSGLGRALDHPDSLALLEHQTRVLESVAAGEALGEVLTGIAAALEELIEGSRCSILLVDPSRSRLHHGAAPSLPAEYARAIDGLEIGPEAGSCGTAAYLGHQVVAEDIAADPRWERFRALALPHGLRSCWSTPIRARGETVGTFAVYWNRPHRPGRRDEQLVERCTHLASVAIEHSALYRALAESEERFRRAFEDNAVGMALTGLDGRVSRVNRSLQELFGCAEADLLGARLADLVAPAGGAAVLDRLGELPPEGAHFEAGGRHRSGRLLTLAVALSPVRGADGTPSQVCVNLVDMTERRAAERDRMALSEARAARRGAEAASRSKSALVSALSHEVRTPLQAITGFTELLGSLDLGVERRREALGSIQAASEHILSLVDDMLDLARIEAGALPLDLVEVDAAEVAAEVLDMLQPLAGERSVALVDGGLAGVLRADRRRLRQVLINLVTNGIRYNRVGGSVCVSSGPCRVKGPVVEVTVSDTGRGIPREQLNRLFVPFDRLDADSGPERGAGLGLALARGLTEAMGGSLTVRSAPGAGTAVTLELPAAG